MAMLPLFCMAILSLPGPCFGDGVFIPTVVQRFPGIPVQRAVVKYAGGIETLVVEASLDGDGLSFGWSIPVPNVPRRFEKVSPGLLKTLSLQLEPDITYKLRLGMVFNFVVFVLVLLGCFFYHEGGLW